MFLQGSAWGVFGGALIGLVLERRPMQTVEWLAAIGSLLAAGWVTSLVVVTWLGFQVNPPRNNGSIAFMGAALGLIAWLTFSRCASGLRGALLGYIGFGLGMAVGRLLGNAANILQGPLGTTINHWNVMETSCGFIGGFIFCFGMVNRVYPEPPEEKNVSLASVYGIVYALGVIPLWHRLGRIDPDKKLTEWAASLDSYGYADPEKVARTILWLVDGVCVLGFVGAAIWLAIHFQRRQRFAAFPVIWLSGTMLLFQNLTALFFFYPHREHYINMHVVFWVLFGLMALYVAFARNKPVKVDAEASSDVVERPPNTLAWLTAAAGVLALTVFAAGFVNGERTMQSANTRWPIWAWTHGPFPRDNAPANSPDGR